LYPSNVPEAAYQRASRNQSSAGVTVTPNNTFTDSMNHGRTAFFVSSLHAFGDYAFGVSPECQSNDPDASGTLAPSPSFTATTAGSASITATFNNNEGAADWFSYWVQCGTQPASYPDQSPVIEKAEPGHNTEVIPVPERTLGPRVTIAW